MRLLFRDGQVRDLAPDIPKPDGPTVRMPEETDGGGTQFLAKHIQDSFSLKMMGDIGIRTNRDYHGRPENVLQ